MSLKKRRRKVQKKQQKKVSEYEETLVELVTNEFERRRKERVKLERQWELNRNFLTGNQYCDINRRGEIVQDDKTFYWQSRGVFNHIAPIIESRLARFSRINPSVSVRPKTDDDKDVTSANVAEKLIAEAFKTADVYSVVKKVTAWSEACGTGFYKVVWNDLGGHKIAEINGEGVYEGEVKVVPISPFEIYPDSLAVEDIKAQKSIIHAQAMKVSDIFYKYGVQVEGEEINLFDGDSLKGIGKSNKTDKSVKDCAVVIEYYALPDDDNEHGRLITVASGKLLFEGVLPYVNGNGKQRTYPFIKQECVSISGSFFGAGIIERLIPVQRAFNAVKNRKHEFLNRLSMGVMTVEDGSVDVDDLATEGLSPGKVLVYRQGSKAPEMMNDSTMPNDFNEEENKLLNEFIVISGVSDVSSSSENATLTSGSALEILVEQDNSRLLLTAESIRNSFVEIARHIIRLYAQFMADIKAVKYQDSFDKTRFFYADRNAVLSDDVYLENENELLYTTNQKKEIIFKLYSSGLLNDDKGKLRPSTKEKVLTLLGYKDLDYRKGLSRLQEEKAVGENEQIKLVGLDIEEIDDDSIHVDEHTRYVLSEYDDLSDEQKQRIYAHIKAHRERMEKKEKEINE